MQMPTLVAENIVTNFRGQNVFVFWEIAWRNSRKFCDLQFCTCCRWTHMLHTITMVNTCFRWLIRTESPGGLFFRFSTKSRSVRSHAARFLSTPSSNGQTSQVCFPHGWLARPWHFEEYILHFSLVTASLHCSHQFQIRWLSDCRWVRLAPVLLLKIAGWFNQDSHWLQSFELD